MRLRHLLISASIAAVGTTVVAGPVSAAPTRVGIESFSFTDDINNTGGGTVVAKGVINATGTDIVVSPTEDTFDFGARGQITVFHSPLHSTSHFDEKRCTFRFTETGNYVFGNGTGDWANYSGSGRYRATGSATNACGDQPVGTVTITASGPISPINDG
jgi:hypothetical protein